MKFSCIKENINNGLNTVSHIASKNTSLPILNNILLRLVPGGLELTATNLEVAITTTVRGKTEGEGELAVQGRLLSEAAALLPDEKVEFLIEKNTLTISCGKSRTIIKGVSSDDFPVIPKIDKTTQITLPNPELANTISKVVFTINPDESRPEISGVFLGNVNNKLVFVGTDSYRLAEASLGKEIENLNPAGLIIPLKTAQEVARISQNTEADTVGVFLGENQVLWQIGETKIISRLVVAQYPDYLQIIPKDFNTKIILSREALQQAVKAASLFVRSGINDVKLKFNPTTKTAQISSTNSQLGENTTEISAEIEGAETEVIFNYRYLLDGLAALEGKDITISVVNPNDPSLFESKSNSDYRHLIMPIRQ